MLSCRLVRRRRLAQLGREQCDVLVVYLRVLYFICELQVCVWWRDAFYAILLRKTHNHSIMRITEQNKHELKSLNICARGATRSCVPPFSNCSRWVETSKLIQFLGVAKKNLVHVELDQGAHAMLFQPVVPSVCIIT